MIVVIILVVLLLLVGIAFVVMYNGLVALKNKVEAAWAQIDVQLTGADHPEPGRNRPGAAAREGDPRRGHPGPEHGAERVRAGRGAPPPPNNVLTGCAEVDLRPLSEAYPDLKANQSFFLALQGGARRHRGQDRLRAAVLQRHREPLQHARSSPCRATSSRGCSTSPKT
ncbi:MAG: hypothetical protein R2711_10010 [Acidimicrobiales bacterium]